jgi:hypothetical protein
VHNGRSAATELKPAVTGGNMVMGAEAATEENTEFVVASTEPPSGVRALEPAHRLLAAFEAAVILLQVSVFALLVH